MLVLFDVDERQVNRQLLVFLNFFFFFFGQKIKYLTANENVESALLPFIIQHTAAHHARPRHTNLRASTDDESRSESCVIILRVHPRVSPREARHE